MSKTTPKQTVQEFLQQQTAAALATTTEKNVPKVSIIYFVADEDLNFYFLTKVETQKYANLVKHSTVSLAIFDQSNLRLVEAEGVAQTSDDPDSRPEVTEKLQQLMQDPSSPWSPPIAKIEAGDYVIVKITPTWLRWADFKNTPEGKPPFTQIIPES